jgi:hypothetical protein
VTKDVRTRNFEFRQIFGWVGPGPDRPVWTDYKVRHINENIASIILFKCFLLLYSDSVF